MLWHSYAIRFQTMALTPSSMLPLGTPAPDFCLPEPLTGKPRSRDGIAAGRPLLVMFICNHCPYVVHVRDELIRLGREYAARGVASVAISSNDAEHYPDDGPARMAALARELDFPFPYLYDESQVVARDYQAACTPDFYLFDAGLRCVYRGRLDGATPGNDEPVTGRELRAALDALLAGEPIPEPQLPSVGCNIKWKVA